MSRAIPKNPAGAECPECESRRTYCQATGYTDEGYRLRRRKCVDCEAPSFLTAEVVLPGASWGELDTGAHLRARDSYRRNRKALSPFRAKPHLMKRPATLSVRVLIRRAA
jgi:hypothetical protein